MTCLPCEVGEVPRSGGGVNAIDSIAARLLAALNCRTPTVLVIVARTKGSVPRETGAWMIVTEGMTTGTIGGGHLELKSIEIARGILGASVCPEQSEGLGASGGSSNPSRRSGRTEKYPSGTLAKRTAPSATLRQFPLGPALGQCCGGAVEIAFVSITESDRAWLVELAEVERSGGRFTLRCTLDSGATLALPLTFNPWHIWVFGAGHVGRAIVHVLATLPCAVTWVDSRDAQFPSAIAANVTPMESDTPAHEACCIPSGAQVLVLTHSHALDLEICAALIGRDDLGYVGVIGSDTKAATFRRRFEQQGRAPEEIARMICPIGAPCAAGVIHSKHPGVIAVGVAADLIERRQLYLERRIEQGPTCEK